MGAGNTVTLSGAVRDGQCRESRAWKHGVCSATELKSQPLYQQRSVLRSLRMCSPDPASPSADGRDGAFPAGLLKVGLGSSSDEAGRAPGTEQVTERMQLHPLPWGLMLPVRGRGAVRPSCASSVEQMGVGSGFSPV